MHAALLSAMGPGAGGLGPARPAPGLQVWLTEAPLSAAAAPQAAGPAEAPSIRGPFPARYFKSSEVDERAAPVDIAPLMYPERAYMNRLRGTVRLRIYISREGRIDRADIVAASPAGHFEQAAIDALQRTRFRPALKAGRPVASQKLIEVEFDPYGPTPEERP